MPVSHMDLLRAIPEKHANPDPATLASLPKGGVNLSYMGHAEVTLALIDVDPAWEWEPLGREPDGSPVIIERGQRLVMWAKLTVCGKSIIGVGTCESRKGDPEKELIGDFLRNAAMRFGIGTKLWSKATTADPVGRSQEPTLSAASVSLFRRLRDVKGTPLETELKQLAAENNRKLTAAAFDEDDQWRDLVAAVVNDDAADRLDAAHDAGML